MAQLGRQYGTSRISYKAEQYKNIVRKSSRITSKGWPKINMQRME
jgi:hypothetical protein